MDTPSPISRPISGADFRRRRRGRNLAMLAVLLALVALFYAMTWVRMGQQVG